MRHWGHMGTVPRAGIHVYFPREVGRGHKELGRRRKGKAGKNPEREGVGPQFIPTRYKGSSLLKMQTPPGMVEPSPTLEVKCTHQTILELV